MNWSSPTKVIVQGIIDSQTTFYVAQMKSHGTEIVAGVSPGHGGTTIVNLPVFDLVDQAITQFGKIDTSLVFVDAHQVLDTAKEAITAGIKQIVIFTPQVPPLDTIKLIKYAKANETLVLGPGSHGIVIPQKTWLGKLDPQFYEPGRVGLITTSEYLSYEVAAELNQAEIGQSIIVSIGQDPIVGSDILQWLSILNNDPNTEAIVSIGQSINAAEEIVAYCKNHSCEKPIIVYVAGLKTPTEKMFRDALTIIHNHLSNSIPAVNRDRQKINKLKKAGIMVAKKPSEIPKLIQEAFSINEL